jgi:hypothetical protein
MVLTEDKEKKELRTAFRMLLAAHNFSFRWFCILNHLNYSQSYHQTFRYKKLEIKRLNKLIELLDPRKEARVVNEVWVISQKTKR